MLHNPSARKPAGFRPTPQELALVGITIIWGSSFVITHAAVQQTGPFVFVGMRYLVAGLLGLLLFGKVMRGLTRLEFIAGFLIGADLTLGLGLQAWGLRTIASSQSAFLSALYVPIVPLMQWAFLRRTPHLMSWVGILLAFTGLMFLAGTGARHLSFQTGEILSLLGTIAMAAEIILISHFAPNVDSRRVTVVQLLSAGLAAFAFMPLSGEGLPAFHPLWVSCAVGLGIVSVVIQLTMNWGQKTVSPTRATVIYAGEPVWGGLFGCLSGDRLSPFALVGAAFIVSGVIASEWRPKPKQQLPD